MFSASFQVVTIQVYTVVSTHWAFTLRSSKLYANGIHVWSLVKTVLSQPLMNNLCFTIIMLPHPGSKSTLKWFLWIDLILSLSHLAQPLRTWQGQGPEQNASLIISPKYHQYQASTTITSKRTPKYSQCNRSPLLNEQALSFLQWKQLLKIYRDSKSLPPSPVLLQI